MPGRDPGVLLPRARAIGYAFASGGGGAFRFGLAFVLLARRGQQPSATIKVRRVWIVPVIELEQWLYLNGRFADEE